MLSRLRPRSIYDVLAAIACFGVLAGGTAYAANTIGSTDIIDGQVKSVDVGDSEILSADVKDQSLTTFDVSTFLGADVVDGTLTGADVQDNSLAGADIDESALSLAVEPVTPVPASGTNGFAPPWGNDPDFGGPAGYWKDPAGSVHLRGTVSRLGSMAGSRIFTLPEGYRPPAAEVFAVGTPGGTDAQIQVMASGQVHAHAGSASDFGLSGITFRP
jgi:hypothetical protein